MDQFYNEAERKHPAQIHKVLNAVFKLCRPSDTLRIKLEERFNWPDEIIDQYILAAPPFDIVQRLYENYGFTDDDLLGVPGFFQTADGSVQLKRYINVDYGIAVRSIGHKITGILLHFRPANGQGGSHPENEIAWLSAKGEYMGTPSGSPAGMVGKPGDYMYYDESQGKRRYATEIELGKRGNIFITDSFFKAAACHQQYGTRALFMTGAQNMDSLPRMLETLTRKSGSRQKVIIAPDRYWRSDSAVMESWLKVIEQIYSQCLPIWVAVWEPAYGAQMDAVMHSGYANAITPKRISKVFLPHICRRADAEASSGDKRAEQFRAYVHYMNQLITRWENQVELDVIE